ncbi:unnamed protein product, partial [Mesorhabditis spiculigera]
MERKQRICQFRQCQGTALVPRIEWRSSDADDKLLTVPFLAIQYGTGLCNQLFELVALLGMAAQTNRIATVNIEHSQVMTRLIAIGQNFPALAPQLHFSMLPPSAFHEVSIGRDACCRYSEANMELLKAKRERLVVAYGIYYQSFKYFWDIRDKIVEWLAPAPVTSMIIDQAFPSEYMSQNVFEHQNQKYLDVEGIRFVFVTSATPEFDLGVSHKFCSNVLLTAPASTFGWFIGFLGSGGTANVYYAENYSKPNGISRELDEEDFFPPNWIKLRQEKRVKFEELKENKTMP